MAAFASAAATRLCDPMLPDLARHFGGSAAEVAWAVSGYAVAYGCLQVIFGPLGDRLGKYRLIALCTLACVPGSLLAAMASSLHGLIAARMLTGVTAAGIIPLAMAWIGDTVPYEQRQSTLARFLIGQVLGVVGGQFIGGIFADTLGWRWAFGAMALLYLAVGVGVLAQSRLQSRLQAGLGQGAAAGTGPGAAPSDMLGQIRTVWQTPWARTILAVVFTEGALIFGALAFVPSHVHNRFGLTLSAAGGLMACFGVGGLSYVLFARHFVQRLGEIGLAKLGGGALCLAWLTLMWAPSWGWTLPACYLSGVGYYALHNTLQTNATQMAPSVRGTAVSLFASSFFLGQSVGVSLAALAIARLGPLSPFVVSAVLTPALALLFARLLRQRHAPTQQLV
ncbi:MFS transporter [Aquabacterium sp.]|uniref:MFS transporter n=1 Tax=Aquabacterium sp. TaxID=1872578 RepID=UPI0025BFE627|nr:MFS transporter [Aquabacterium sp.]